MTRFRLTIEYDGRPFMGWQRQPHGPSVQAAIEDAGKAITGETIILHAAGRTDAGVHAEAMSAHLDVAKAMTAFRLMEGINAKLRPHPVAILDCAPVADDWHARFSCIGRRYLYRIVNRRAPLALDRGRAWRVPQMLNAWGHMVPDTPENVAKKEKDEAVLAKQEARDKAAAEKAEKKRLAACARRGIPDNECAPPEGVATVSVGTSDAG